MDRTNERGGGGKEREGVSVPCQPLINDVVRGGAVKRCGIRGHAGSGGPPLTGSADAAPLCTTSAA